MQTVFGKGLKNGDFKLGKQAGRSIFHSADLPGNTELRKEGKIGA